MRRKIVQLLTVVDLLYCTVHINVSGYIVCYKYFATLSVLAWLAPRMDIPAHLYTVSLCIGCSSPRMDTAINIHTCISLNMPHTTCVYRWYRAYIQILYILYIIYGHCESDILLITVGGCNTQYDYTVRSSLYAFHMTEAVSGIPCQTCRHAVDHMLSPVDD